MYQSYNLRNISESLTGILSITFSLSLRFTDLLATHVTRGYNVYFSLSPCSSNGYNEHLNHNHKVTDWILVVQGQLFWN